MQDIIEREQRTIRKVWRKNIRKHIDHLKQQLTLRLSLIMKINLHKTMLLWLLEDDRKVNGKYGIKLKKYK